MWPMMTSVWPWHWFEYISTNQISEQDFAVTDPSHCAFIRATTIICDQGHAQGYVFAWKVNIMWSWLQLFLFYLLQVMDSEVMTSVCPICFMSWIQNHDFSLSYLLQVMYSEVMTSICLSCLHPLLLIHFNHLNDLLFNLEYDWYPHRSFSWILISILTCQEHLTRHSPIIWFLLTLFSQCVKTVDLLILKSASISGKTYSTTWNTSDSSNITWNIKEIWWANWMNRKSPSWNIPFSSTL
jgi:hypothetical protein